MPGAPGSSSRGRGGKFRKFTRGGNAREIGGKHFSRNLQPIDSEGNPVSIWSKDGKQREEASEEESEEDSEEESSEEETNQTAAQASSDANREDRKAQKKARKEAAIAKAKALKVEVGDLPPSSDEESDEDLPLPANPNHSSSARKQASKAADVEEITEGVKRLPASRREREAADAAAAKERYMKLHAEGKTDEAKADIARLKAIRAQREADAARRQAEKEEKDEREKERRAEIEAREAKLRALAAGPKKDRLRDHAKAFDGLLSLIPAKMYYGEDTSDQWKKEKQTKEEAAAARRAKLDPDSALNRNAKEVMEERAKSKRKLRQMEQEDNAPEEEDYESVTGVEAEKPLEGLKKKSPETPQKKPKTNGDVEIEGDDEDQDEAQGSAEGSADTPKLSKREEKRAAKLEKKAEKKAEKKSKPETGEAQTPAKTPAKTPVKDAAESASTPASKKQKNKKATKEAATPSKPQPTPSKSHEAQVDDSNKADDQMEGLEPSLDFSGLQREDDVSTPDSEPHSPTFDSNETANGIQPASTELTSTTTSISSIASSEKPKHLKIPADTTALRARLAAKIEALRAARKADGTNGKPVRTRQELIEQRRFKEAQRKAHKQELRKLAKDEEQRKREEALASNSPGVMSPNISLDDASGGFTFGRVAFADGTQMSHDLSYFLNRGKKKGPSDPKTALLKVQNEKKRLEDLDVEKRKDIEEKETWLNARRRVEGEKIHDDETMLKKAVKRKEVTKKKSEKAWQERSIGVAQAQRERQKKREENIKQRRDDKLLKRSGKKKKGGKGGAGKGGAGKKKGGRPGFEGSFGVGGKRK
ncbi:hypothetical protein ACHAQJ_002342 [Trichoderma viride]